MPARTNRFSVSMMVCACLFLSACPGTGSETAGGAHSPAVVYDAASDRFFSVTVRYAGGDRNQWKITGRFIDSGGAPAGSESVISESGEEYACPSIAADGVHHRFLVAWSRSNSLMGQLVNEDGTLYQQPFILTRTGGRGCPSVAYDNANDAFLAAWGEDNAARFDTLYVQFITAEGTPAGAKILVSGNAAPGVSPALAYDGINQTFFCTWESAGHGTLGCLINPDGSFAVREFLLSAANGIQHRPGVVFDIVNTRFLVTWEESDAEGDSLRGQVLDAVGAPVSPSFAISSSGCTVSYHSSAYDPAARKYFVIFGNDEPDNEHIYGQIVTADGSLDSPVAGSNLMLSYPGYPGNRRPALAFNATSPGFLAAWEYGGAAQGYGDIHGLLLYPDGSRAGRIFVLSNGGAW